MGEVDGSFKSTNQVYIKNYFQIWFTQNLPNGLLIQIKRLLLTNESYLSLPVNINSSQRHIMYRYRNQTSLIYYILNVRFNLWLYYIVLKIDFWEASTS